MILDSSALIASFGVRRIRRALRGQELAAPDLLVAETLNVLWKMKRAGYPVPERALVIRLFDAIVIEPSPLYALRAAALADVLDHPVYGCFYLALAEGRNDVLLTTDTRLARKVAKTVMRKQIRLVAQD